MNSNTGEMIDLRVLGEKLLSQNPEQPLEILDARIKSEANALGFDVQFNVGDEVTFHGVTLVLVYVNVGQRRLTFTPKVATTRKSSDE